MQLQVVKDYYGKLLKSSKDLKTSACCDGATIPSHVRPLLDNVHPEVASKYQVLWLWACRSGGA
jgi:arsenite methyltransferase